MLVLTVRLLLYLYIVQAAVTSNNELFKLSVIHFNDFHARFDETNNEGGDCKIPGECIGGFSRLYAQIKHMREDDPHSILLNAGDTFQGTLWYTVGRWNVSQQFMNKLDIDAEVLGNHDFDDGIHGIVPYIKALNHPVIVSNIDDSAEPEIQNTYTKSTIIERYGKKIGIIGVTTVECKNISNTGNLVFLPESASVNKEAERLVKEEGVFTNIVLSHVGYAGDQLMAKNASEKISLIVGGHSHTFLYTGDNPPGPDVVGGPYPTIIPSKRGHKVLVVQASAFCKYLGNITIFLDQNGEISYYSGGPIFLSKNLPQDEKINDELLPWKKLVDEIGSTVVGSSLVELSTGGCNTRECTLGNFIADATVYAFTNSSSPGSWSGAALAVVNSAGLRSSLGPGNITYSDLVISQPFGNTIDMGEIEGRYIKEMFEYSIETEDLLQVSGFKVIYDLSQPMNNKVSSIKIRCLNCTIPKYEEIDWNQSYKIGMCSYLSNGNGGYSMISSNLKHKKVGSLDLDIFMDYLAHRSPIFQEEEGRIVVITKNQATTKLSYYYQYD